MTLIIILMLLGLLLLFYELYFIPGTSIVGMVGGLLCILAIVTVFRRFGSMIGYTSLFITMLVVFIMILVGARNKVWQRISNQNILARKTNMVAQDQIKPGLKGVAWTTIRPIGTGKFGDLKLIVQSQWEDIPKGTPIEVVKVVVTKVIVKSIDNNA